MAQEAKKLSNRLILQFFSQKKGRAVSKLHALPCVAHPRYARRATLNEALNGLLLIRFTLLCFLDNNVSNVLGALAVMTEFHGELATARRHGSQVTNVAKHL